MRLNIWQICIKMRLLWKSIISVHNMFIMLLVVCHFWWSVRFGISAGDLTRRLCTVAEIKFYFSSFFDSGPANANYLRPNKNCNLNSWASGCEPGWGCSVGEDQPIDLKSSKEMPSRVKDCQPCCEGFFCPQGITCMIRKYYLVFCIYDSFACWLLLLIIICYFVNKACPLGSYCPMAKLNKTTGICDPWVTTESLSLRFFFFLVFSLYLIFANFAGTIIKFLLGRRITHAVEQIYGLMLWAAAKCSAPQDPTARPPRRASLAVVGINFHLIPCALNFYLLCPN